MSSFKLFSKTETSPKLQKNIEKNLEIIITLKKLKITKLEKLPKIIEKKFFLVGRHFNNERKCSNLMNKLQSESYNSEIIGTNKNGLIRVSYDCFIQKKSYQN